MGKRKSIEIAGFAHTNPIPAACRVGNMLMTGIITGMDPATGKVAPTLEAQCAFTPCGRTCQHRQAHQRAERRLPQSRS